MLIASALSANTEGNRTLLQDTTTACTATEASALLPGAPSLPPCVHIDDLQDFVARRQRGKCRQMNGSLVAHRRRMYGADTVYRHTARTILTLHPLA